MMDIYERYHNYGLEDYKLRNADDVIVLHGINLTEVVGLDDLSEYDRDLFIKLFINYLNGWGCNNRNQVPLKVTKSDSKFKVVFDNETFSYLYFNGTVG